LPPVPRLQLRFSHLNQDFKTFCVYWSGMFSVKQVKIGFKLKNVTFSKTLSHIGFGIESWRRLTRGLLAIHMRFYEPNKI
jgi:hypothetical protein